ncbi:MAG: decarboxylating 6-phosphogluconate dehydrogenase [Planctomycetota bacterium]|jgi:6-phosphogluconate dehydrogenase|nr:MAG: decarboxylating 6-phosphogluconate dehydrogenase [Planctomycetota bacterium]RLS92255.1 MAG: decarboxylating 6-phosphogluconate dehydrogenase [Planctomycetota bacterium]
MQIAMIGLGRMGANMARRLMKGGHSIVAFDVNSKSVAELASEGAIAATSLADVCAKLKSQPGSVRYIWLMLPVAFVDSTINALLPHLSANDCIIDGGNSCYIDDIRRGKELTAKGMHYIDVGVSGGVWGLERGYCHMIGGDVSAVKQLDSIFATLAPGIGDISRNPGAAKLGTAEMGYLHCGPVGAGHFVKMVHNGIEYGLMSAYAEGLNILKHADAGKHEQVNDAETTPLRNPEHYQYEFDLAAITEMWRRGSVVGSWLLDLTAQAMATDPSLDKFGGRVSDSGEGRWTLAAANDEGVPAPVLAAALFGRFSSRGNAEFMNKVMSAQRFAFGGHLEKKD